MNGPGTAKSKGGSEAEQEFREEAEQREDTRRSNEQIEQQDLNQGMDTGTHSSSHSGVNWGPSYRMMPRTRQTPAKEHIAARAYELYVQRGGQDGRHLDDWLLAEKELTQGSTEDDSAPRNSKPSSR